MQSPPACARLQFRRTSGALAALLIASLTLSCALTKLHLDTVDNPNRAAQEALHNDIVAHRAPAPYQYRVLQPLLVEALCVVTDMRDSRAGVLLGYAALRLLCIWLTLIGTYAFLAQIGTHTAAAAGSLLIASLIPFTYQRYYYQPSSVMEWACYAVGLWLIARRAAASLVLLVLVGTLNRETMVFVPFLWVLWWGWPRTRTDWLATAGALGTWAAVFMGLRLLFPASLSLDEDVLEHVRTNMTGVGGNVDVFLMTVPWVVLACWPAPQLRGRSRFRRMLLLYAVWVPLHFTFAFWYEVRYYLPPLLAALPAILSVALPGSITEPCHAGAQLGCTVCPLHRLPDSRDYR